ncbi:uncharacterized protein LOC142833327 [Microtus pennsylvanicus]|uniref:uncharacterized protein LOC142833327 n=1 Tax=Microtus pennsylvanicus TaxID=10058 RepID=UPI003F6B8F75
MPPRALRRAAAAASLRLRAPPPRSPPPAPRPRPPPLVPARRRGLQPRACHWALLPGSRAPAVLIGRWGFIHEPPPPIPSAYTFTPRGRGRHVGSGAGVAPGPHPPLVPPAWAPLSPQRGSLGALSVPRSTQPENPPASQWAGGLLAPGGAPAASRDSARHSSPLCAAACGPGSRGLQRERGGVASRLGTARLLTSAASPTAASGRTVRSSSRRSHGLCFPPSLTRLNLTTTGTSAALKVQQAQTESDRLGLQAFRRLSFLLLGTEARSSPGVSRPLVLPGTVFVTVWSKTKISVSRYGRGPRGLKRKRSSWRTSLLLTVRRGDPQL